MFLCLGVVELYLGLKGGVFGEVYSVGGGGWGVEEVILGVLIRDLLGVVF